MAVGSYGADLVFRPFGPGGPAVPVSKEFQSFLPTLTANAADVQQYQLPSYFVARPLKRVTARLETPSTSGDVTFRLELYTGTATFTATQTSDTFTLPAGQSEIDVTSFTNGLVGNGNNKVRVYVITAGTGAANLTVKGEW